MSTSISDVLEFIEDNDVKFIRLAFCDIFGMQKNISILPNELMRAFSDGICFDASALAGFMKVESSDLLLFPDPTTLCVLPWRPSTGRVVRFFCDIRYPDGRAFEGDGRQMLRQAVSKLSERNLTCMLGTECEFYLFELDESGTPTRIPYDNASYFDVAPLDRGENVRRQICMTLEEMGIQPEASHHEQGPGQNEIDFKYSGALQAADNMITFKWVVKTIANSSGLFASFLPKPLAGEPGSGLHVNLSLFRNGKNIFCDPNVSHSETAESFIAGVLAHAKEMNLFFNPLVNSYERMGEFEAPRYITWSHQNRSPLIRIPAASGIHRRMEYRASDGTLNPYLAFTLLLHAGLDGVEKKLKLPEPCNVNLFTADRELLNTYDSLPSSLDEAITAAENSDFIKNIIPSRTLENYLAAKRQECNQYSQYHSPHSAAYKLYFERY